MTRYLMIAFLLSAGSALAQKSRKTSSTQQERKEKMEAMKIAFITNKLSLTPEEAQKFWPVHNEFTEKKEALRKKQMEGRKGKSRNLDSLSDKEATALIENKILFREQQTALLKEYTPKFKSVLPVKKVAMLYQAEKEFRSHKKDKKQKQSGAPREKGPKGCGGKEG